jgi:enterochelin esterase-like enzyme
MLVSAAFVAAVTAAAIVIPVAWIIWERRRRAPGVTRIVWRSAFAIFTIIGIVAAVAAALNRHYSYIPDAGSLVGHVSPDLNGKTRFVAADADEPMHGVVQKAELAGIGFSAKPLYVYLPPQYLRSPTRRFPVLYLLHGSPGVAIDWIRTGRIDRTMDALLAQHAVRPFIIAMPDFDLNYARDTQCEDIPGGPQMQTYLTHDVVQYIDTHYRTIPARGARIIGGFSAGAYCGINLTMRHQDVFSGFVSQSGYTTPDSNAYTRDLFGHNRALRRENTPALYLPWTPIEPPLGAYIEAGWADRDFRTQSVWVASVLRKHGALVSLHIFKGPDHGWRDARAHAGYMLRWVSSWFELQSPVNSGRTLVTSRSWRKAARI